MPVAEAGFEEKRDPPNPKSAEVRGGRVKPPATHIVQRTRRRRLTEATGKVTEEEEVSEEKRKELMMVSAGRGCKEVLWL